MVDFNPKINWTDRALKAHRKYAESKAEVEKLEANIEQFNNGVVAYATIDLKDGWSSEDTIAVEELVSHIKEEISERQSELTIELLRENQEAIRTYRTSISEKLVELLQMQPEHKVGLKKAPAFINKIIDEKGYALVAIYANTYIVPKSMLTMVDNKNNSSIGNELLVKENNQISVTSDLNKMETEIEAVNDFTHEALASKLEEVNILKAQMEAKISELHEQQALMLQKMEAKLAEYKHQLLIMKTDITAFEYRHGLTVNFTPIHKGEKAPVEQPIIVHQKIIFLDEDLPRLQEFYDIDSNSLEVAIKNSDALLEHICPTNKGITFLKNRHSSKKYHLNNTVMKFILDTTPNSVGMVVRNGENVWLTWFDENDIELSEDSFASKATDEYTSLSLVKSRYYISNVILGLIERGELLQLNHSVTDLFNDTGIIFSNADSQIADSTYIELGELVDKLNKYTRPDDPIYVLNTIRDKASYSYYGSSGETERGRGDNSLTDGVVVERGFHRIKGVDYMTNLTARFYVSGEKDCSFSWEEPKKIKPALYIENDEYINLKFLTSTLVDYYIHTKRIGRMSNSGMYVDYSHMLPILFNIKEKLIEQEKIDRLHIPAKDYDLNLLTSFKIIHNIRNITEYQAKRYSKWVTQLSEEELASYGKLLNINNLDDYSKLHKTYILLAKSIEQEEYKNKQVERHYYYTVKEKNSYQYYIGNEGTYCNYAESFVSPQHEFGDRIKTFTSEKKAREFLETEKIYQTYTPSGEEYKKRDWEIVDFNEKKLYKKILDFIKK